jgi:hypothetical protein
LVAGRPASGAETPPSRIVLLCCRRGSEVGHEQKGRWFP